MKATCRWHPMSQNLPVKILNVPQLELLGQCHQSRAKDLGFQDFVPLRNENQQQKKESLFANENLVKKTSSTDYLRSFPGKTWQWTKRITKNKVGWWVPLPKYSVAQDSFLRSRGRGGLPHLRCPARAVWGHFPIFWCFVLKPIPRPRPTSPGVFWVKRQPAVSTGEGGFAWRGLRQSEEPGLPNSH